VKRAPAIKAPHFHLFRARATVMGVDANVKDLLQGADLYRLAGLAVAPGQRTPLDRAWSRNLHVETLTMAQHRTLLDEGGFRPDRVLLDGHLVLRAVLGRKGPLPMPVHVVDALRRWIATSFAAGAETVYLFWDIRSRVPLAKGPERDRRREEERRRAVAAGRAPPQPFGADELADCHVYARDLVYAGEPPPQLADGHWFPAEATGGWARVVRDAATGEWVRERTGPTHVALMAPLPDVARLIETPALMDRLVAVVSEALIGDETGVRYGREPSLAALRVPRRLIVDGVMMRARGAAPDAPPVPHAYEVCDHARSPTGAHEFQRVAPAAARTAHALRDTDAGEADIRVAQKAIELANRDYCVWVRAWDSDMLPLLLMRVPETLIEADAQPRAPAAARGTVRRVPGHYAGRLILDLRTPANHAYDGAAANGDGGVAPAPAPEETGRRVVDVQALHSLLMQWAAEAWRGAGVTNPIETLCLLVVAGGNDYFEGVPGSRVKRVLELAHARIRSLSHAIRRSSEAVGPLARVSYTLDVVAVADLLQRLYARNCCGLARAIADVPPTADEMRAAIVAKARRSSTATDAAVDEAVAAAVPVGCQYDAAVRRLEWWLNYANAGWRGFCVAPEDSVAVDARTGLSRYGWVRRAEDQRVVRARAVSREAGGR